MSEEFKEEGGEMAEVLHEGPPLEWYSGVGYKDEGIQRVGYNEVLLDMADGQVGEQIDRWDHYNGNPPTENDSPERIARAEQAIAGAEVYIKEQTGFSPREIADKRSALRQMFKGKKEAPFEFDLF